MSTTFDRSRLSKRENEILDYATEGLTDQQIALRLGISAATVGSYWVRVRGKVGHLSRTELVALCLKSSAQESIEALIESKRTLEEQVKESVALEETVLEAPLWHTILECLPVAVMAFTRAGKLRYANAYLESLIGYSPASLIGGDIDLLLPSSHRNRLRETLLEAFVSPQPTRLGSSNVIYLRRKDGYDLRVFILMNAARDGEGNPLAICVVRSFTEELDALRLRSNETSFAGRTELR